jgi:hypothetical protein
MTRPTIILLVKKSKEIVLKIGLGLAMVISLSACNIGSKKDAPPSETTLIDSQLSQIITQLNLNQHPQRD